MNKDRVVLSLGRTLFSFSTNYLFKTDVTMAFYCQHTRLCFIISISIMMINACKQEIKTVSCKRYKKKSLPNLYERKKFDTKMALQFSSNISIVRRHLSIILLPQSLHIFKLVLLLCHFPAYIFLKKF